ncbi:NAD(P)-binding protein [Meredithblackwellia eburnea MCA 4105]
MATSSKIPVVAVVGLTGLVGTSVLPSLLSSNKVSLRLLSTSPDSPSLKTLLDSAPQPSNASVCKIEWSDEGSLVTGLEGVDVLVSLLASRTPGVMDSWKKLIEAAGKANVKTYFPSEFGTDPDLASRLFPPAGFELKKQHKLDAEALGMRCFHVYTGMFLEGGFDPRNGIDTENHSWALASKGDTPFAVTSTRDLGPFVLRCILLAFHSPSLVPSSGSMQIYSSCSTWNEYVKTWEKVSGKGIEVKWLSEEDLLDGMKNGPGGGFPAFVKLLGEDGGFDHSRSVVIPHLMKEEFGGEWDRWTVERVAKERIEAARK